MKSVLSMAAGTFSSRILGFVRDTIMFQLFGRGITDAYVVAFSLPNMFRRLFGEGSLTVSFIPVFVEARASSERRAEALANAMFTIVLTISMVIAGLCFIFMDDIIWFMVGDPRGFAANPGKVEQTIYLARIMIFYVVLVCSYAFHMAVANTLGHFFWPAFGPTLFNLGLILFTVLPFELGPYGGSSQAWGVIFGGVLQSGIVIWLLWREGALPRLSWQWGGADVKRVFVNMVPGLFGLGVFQVMTFVNKMFAAALPEGAQSYVYLADRVLELPQSLIAVSLGAALLPRFSEHEARGDRQAFLLEANQAVRMLLYLSLPAAVGLYVLALPITQVLFMRGAFTQADAEATAAVVSVYSVLLLFSSLSRVTAPAFYAIKNTWLPAVVAAGVLGVHLVVGPILVREFGLIGLASATSGSAILNILVLQICFYFWLGPLGYGQIFMSALRLVPALAALGVFCSWAYPVSLGALEAVLPAYGAKIVALSATIGAAMPLYFGLTMIFGSEAGRRLAQLRLRKKP